MKALVAVILVIAVAGLAFSGFLSVRELFLSGGQCAPAGEPGSILGAPPCVYGFFMYLAIVIMASLALLGRRASR